MVFEKIRDIIADQLGVEADKITLETKVICIFLGNVDPL